MHQAAADCAAAGCRAPTTPPAAMRCRRACVVVGQAAACAPVDPSVSQSVSQQAHLAAAPSKGRDEDSAARTAAVASSHKPTPTWAAAAASLDADDGQLLVPTKPTHGQQQQLLHLTSTQTAAPSFDACGPNQPKATQSAAASLDVDDLDDRRIADSVQRNDAVPLGAVPCALRVLDCCCEDLVGRVGVCCAR